VVRRAQLVLCLSVLAAAVIVGTQLPLGQILAQRAAIASQTAELAKLRAQSAALSAQVHALNQDSTVATIAHEYYGLVRPGQISYVILPAAARPGGTPAPLATSPIPAGDIVPSDSAISETQQTPPAPTPGAGLANQIVSRLEFWRWAF
jgi:cell division protein FtsB